jgi:acyl-homoserine-lactone acylase
VLPGNTSETLWSEYLTFDELPQVMNPKSGFIQNCNNTPFITTTGDGNPDRSLFSETLGIESRMSNRALRAMELFGNDDKISREEFEEYKYDLKYAHNSYMSSFIDRLVKKSSEFEDEKLIEGIDILKSWDLNTDIENMNATLPIMSFGWFVETHPDDISDETLVDSFKDAVSYLYTHYGKLNVMWGNVNRLIRGDVNLGLAGGPDIAHAVYGLPNENGQIKGWAGDAFLMLVEWGEDGTVQSESIHQYGSNTQHQDSKHYADQTKLFVERKLKPVWRELKNIKANVEKVYQPGKE